MLNEKKLIGEISLNSFRDCEYLNDPHSLKIEQKEIFPYDIPTEMKIYKNIEEVKYILNLKHLKKMELLFEKRTFRTKKETDIFTTVLKGLKTLENVNMKLNNRKL